MPYIKVENVLSDSPTNQSHQLWKMLVSSFLAIFALGFASELASATKTHDLPLLKLPYGTWRAHQHNAESDVSLTRLVSCYYQILISGQVYVFRNVRYAAPPVGDLRWSKPAPPESIHGIQDGSYGHNCIPSSIPDQFFMPGVKGLGKTAGEGRSLYHHGNMYALNRHS